MYNPIQTRSPALGANVATRSADDPTPADTRDAAMQRALVASERKHGAQRRAESREVVVVMLLAFLVLAFFGWMAD